MLLWAVSHIPVPVKYIPMYQLTTIFNIIFNIIINIDVESRQKIHCLQCLVEAARSCTFLSHAVYKQQECKSRISIRFQIKTSKLVKSSD